jgi:pyruvate/2-oxoglutarate dehydrogenase complex dihydrolipoamide acyltransferase (E2) component
MIRNIQAPQALQQDTTISDIFIMRGDRIRRGQLLLILKSNQVETPIQAEYDGWVQHVAVAHDQTILPEQLLLNINTIEDNDYRIDSGELNPESELGKDGRRGLERDGQKQFANDYAAPLFDAPQQNEGGQQRHGVKQHPFLQNAKEGVPPKMSHANNNPQATDLLAEDASRDPELAHQLSAELQQRLDVNPGPSAAPTMTRG